MSTVFESDPEPTEPGRYIATFLDGSSAEVEVFEFDDGRSKKLRAKLPNGLVIALYEAVRWQRL